MELENQSPVDKDKISIIHFSDFHFSKENESEIQTVLDPLIDDIKSLRAKYDMKKYHIVISGDIASKGEKADYDFAHEWLNLMLALKKCL
jgi:3',5'-cyclic AMP phosphodiesterase CpdA